MLYYAVLCCSIPCYAMLCYAMPLYAMLCHSMLFYAILCCTMLCYAMLCYAMLYYAILCHAMPCHATLCYAMLCCAMLCYAMLCYAVLCYAVLCHVMLCSTFMCASPYIFFISSLNSFPRELEKGETRLKDKEYRLLDKINDGKFSNSYSAFFFEISWTSWLKNVRDAEYFQEKLFWFVAHFTKFIFLKSSVVFTLLFVVLFYFSYLFYFIFPPDLFFIFSYEIHSEIIENK